MPVSPPSAWMFSSMVTSVLAWLRGSTATLMTSRILLAGTPVRWMETPGMGPPGFAGFGGSGVPADPPIRCSSRQASCRRLASLGSLLPGGRAARGLAAGVAWRSVSLIVAARTSQVPGWNWISVGSMRLAEPEDRVLGVPGRAAGQAEQALLHSLGQGAAEHAWSWRAWAAGGAGRRTRGAPPVRRRWCPRGAGRTGRRGGLPGPGWFR